MKKIDSKYVYCTLDVIYYYYIYRKPLDSTTADQDKAKSVDQGKLKLF